MYRNPINCAVYTAEKLQTMTLNELDDLATRWTDYRGTEEGDKLSDRLSDEYHRRGTMFPA